MAERPAPVTVVAAFLTVAAAIGGITGFSLALPGTPLDGIWKLNPSAHAAFAVLSRSSGILLLIIAVAAASAALGLLRGRRWAWALAVAIFAVDAAGDLASAILTGEYVKAAAGILIAALFLFLLLLRRVRDYFAARA